MTLRLLLCCLVPAAIAIATPYVVQTASRSDTSLRRSFNLTAINGRDGESVLECWQLKRGFSSSSTPGQVGSLVLELGDFHDTTLDVLPGQFDGGLHNAPTTQLVYFISGQAVVSLPNSTDQVTVQGGKFGLIAAADTIELSQQGHRTRYPGMAETIALSLPLDNWTNADYTLLHNGACTEEEMSAL